MRVICDLSRVYWIFKYGSSAARNVYRCGISLTNDIAKTFADAIKFELQNLGFKIGDNGKKLTVGLVRFYNDFKMGFFAGDAVADGLINVAIKDKSGELLFSKSYEGGAIEPNIQLALGHNAEIALKKTMANIVEKIAHDKDMHSALLK